MDIIDDSAEGIEIEELREYQALMEFPILYLANAAGLGARIGEIDDHEIVTIAATRINTLKRMILATGFNADMLKAIMEEGPY